MHSPEVGTILGPLDDAYKLPLFTELSIEQRKLILEGTGAQASCELRLSMDEVASQVSTELCSSVTCCFFIDHLHNECAWA